MNEIDSVELFKEVRSLGIPADSYMIFGSGILTALNIRPSKDIDLLVTHEVFDLLRKQGWQYGIVEIEGRPRQKVERGIVEAFGAYWCDGIDYNIEQMIEGATIIDGIRFMSLEDLLVLKRSMGREKDLEDIGRIEKYLVEEVSI